MVRTLTAGVLLRDPSSGAVRFFSSGSELPAWANGMVGDHVLSGTGQKEHARVEVDVTVHDSAGGTLEGTAEATAVGPPPKSGKGSTDANWTAYARTNGVKVTDAMKRAEVIVACEKAGIPTE